MKALSFNPTERYRKAREFGDALATALLGEIDAPSEVTRAQAPKSPSTLPEEASPSPIYKSKAAIAALACVLMLVVGGGLWFALRPKAATTQPPSREAPAAIDPEQSLTYWLTVQKMRDGKPEGDPIESAGDNIFGNGWKFRFNLRPAQPGAMYLLNVGPAKNNTYEYDILFPVPRDNKMDANVAANQFVQTDWLRFVEQTGVEKLWLIWTAKPVKALDTIFAEAARNVAAPGVVTNPEHIAHLQTLLKKYEEAPPESRTDKASKLTLVKGRGEVLVNLIQLSHEAY